MACPSYSALGGRASASHDLSFVRTGGNVDEPLSFEVEINGNPYSFTFEANSDSFTFRTGIFDNPEFGDNPPVEVELIDGAAYNLGAVSSASIEVRDDDPPPIVSFDLFGVPGSVEEGESYSLTFSLSGNTSGLVPFSYTVDGEQHMGGLSGGSSIFQVTLQAPDNGRRGVSALVLRRDCVLNCLLKLLRLTP